ncbi:multiheme c-type cytochrome [Pseudoalteromonas denitrificans]|uniref:Cytochrome c554 and c-prime n=1 Tax=Pseudoalteromonas denitrificans DSM 6059 TaxID=1123010 RepID=A0A1I1Q8F8_9GAMM|nr:multiheme c-type cytochrome [Pseudoalteromonas denitrificans]SFD18277.1 Cytochrome c554 and c-prime [Pseudoalteromonas denitrificans DSM 6059]
MFKSPLIFLFLLVIHFYSQSSMAIEKSNSLLFNADKTKIISANFDTGSISILDRISGDILIEKTIGRDIRRIALSTDAQLLLATDYLNDQVILLDAKTLKVKTITKVPSRPFGVVFDDKNKQFYVTSFEQSKLLIISLTGEIINEIKTEETPRGLALTDDNRLLVTHSLSGQVSLFNTQAILPKLVKVIRLIDTPKNNVKSVPQGQPRLLDNIVISPDGSRAWLPHVLWSFGHDFQFQSSVFPSISILDLTLGKEQEITQERKQLFKQINIIESGNKVRIVSNPHDGAFTQDGKKIIITLAGSEDLMVFDLSRQNNKKKKKRRHRRKKQQGGVKATQIYRNVPGDNPKGLLIDGRQLYVQNAMSLDIAKFDTGAVGPFAKVKLKKASFANLVTKDPLTKQMRLGKTLFNSANTADNQKYPMAGDFWMSCNSCHFDGFNFTNKQLMKAGLKNKFENATTGHIDVVKMIAGDPITAYVDIIQKTQGGMGADTTNDKSKPVDLFSIPVEAAKMMSALNTYVKARENLPYLSTWLRLDDDKKYTHPDEWINSAQCKDCHTTIYDQWADSNHGMNMDHPFYRFQEDFAAKEEGEEFRILCRGCHAPQMIINKDNKSLSEFGDMWDKKANSLNTAYAHGKSVSERGTGCVFCHRITKAENAGGNTDLTVNIKDRQSYIFEDTSRFFLNWLSQKQINASPQAHKDSYSNPELYQSSLYCATCHNEFTTGPGANVNDNFGEWLASPFNAPDDPTQHKTCIDCHMTQDVTDFDNKVAGQSTNDGPVKNNMRSHHFAGGNYYFTGMRSPEHKKISIDILKTALTLEVAKKGADFTALITNANSGHDMPGGARRQVWLEIIATDNNGKQVFTSGVMQNGHIPKNARKFIKIGVDKNNKPVGLKFWRYFKIGKDTRLKSGETRSESFELPVNIQYPITVSTRVLYQVFAKDLTDKVRAAYPDEKIPEPEVIELNKVVKTYLN